MAAPHLVVVSRALVPSHAVVSDAAERAHYWARLLELWGVRGKRATSATFFPGANPVSVSARSVDALAARDYHLCLKSDGVRYALLLTTRPDGSPVALMVDRSRHMYEVEVVAPEEHFRDGTVLEGELVWRQPDEDALLYYVFDAVVVSGERLTHLPFRDRLARATALVHLSEDIRAADDTETRALEAEAVVLTHYDPYVAMRPKRFVARVHAARLWSERADAEHRVDGLILQCMDAAYGGDGAVLKWKDHATVDLAGPALRAADGPLPPRLCGRAVEVLPSRIVARAASDVVEYHVSTDAATVFLMAVRMRVDKTTPNGLRVVEATVGDVVDAVAPAALAAA